MPARKRRASPGNLFRQAVSQLQDWRLNKIGDLRSGEKYEQDKIQRAQKQLPMGSMDRERFASSQRAKPAPLLETPSGAAAFVAPELVTRPKVESGSESKPVLTNGHANGILPPPPVKQKYQIPPLAGVNPISLERENVPDVHLLTKDEVELCERTRLHPKPYLMIKETVMKEALKQNGMLKKKDVRGLTHLEPQKGGRVFDFFVAHGWLG